MKNRIYLHMALLLTVIATAACGGGGGGTSAEQPTKAIVKLSVTGAASQLGGVDVTLSLPAGVTVKSTTAQPETDNGVVVASGQAAANSLVASTYTAGWPGIVHIVLVNGNTNGFGTGEFATITCDLASGNEPSASDFTVQSSSVNDINGSSISGAAVTVGVTLE